MSDDNEPSQDWYDPLEEIQDREPPAPSQEDPPRQGQLPESLTGESLDLYPHIPDELHSAFEEGPFTRCTVCDVLLTGDGQVYYVEKVMRSQECVFEMAVCAGCATKLQQRFSQESLQALQRFFGSYRPSSDTAICHLCQQASGPEADRILSAACARDRILIPLVVHCGACVERSQELLSRETRESYREFMDTHIPGVPAEWEPAPPMVLG